MTKRDAIVVEKADSSFGASRQSPDNQSQRTAHRAAAEPEGAIPKSGDQRTIVTCFSNNGLHRLIAVPS